VTDLYPSASEQALRRGRPGAETRLSGFEPVRPADVLAGESVPRILAFEADRAVLASVQAFLHAADHCVGVRGRARLGAGPGGDREDEKESDQAAAHESQTSRPLLVVFA
jgi:hypothetical protein